MATKTLLTGEDLLRMPDDGKRYELVKGELVEMAPPGEVHGVYASRINRLLGTFVEENDLGTVGIESGFYLERDPDTVRGPDVWFICKERLDPDTEIEGYCEIVPDLAVEVISPNDTYTEVAEKVEEYLQAGVQQVWVVDPKRRTVTLYPGANTLKEGDLLAGGDLLPGFAVPVSRLFQRKKK
ncbi:MAG: Uma2 family endonuclease [Candidatus Tectomicrobia bacterium]|uniref:Uma2 family endonuclease n=1 Tax=Tectimicrobiota bacterium TaxID=2528274 RepID=A0A932CMZ4_UNCTE|nr:Uma2 family endonuclease [Candidatus Tectomicrobia bacterium]